MNHKTLLCIVWMVLIVALPATFTHAQGLSREDRKQVSDSLTSFESLPRSDQRPPIVDLRPHLPEVGRQTMNDCAAWAFGYAARSYLEAVDQGWRPDSPQRIFSPTFIYNQVNKGKDKGSHPLDVLKLLRDKGAATLQAQPYLAENYLTQPRPESFEEAQTFPILGFHEVSSGEAMREALAQGDILVVGVRTNPLFNSGRYDTYTAKAHEVGKAMRRPNQPHGFHAMVVCGYSDYRKAFLFMNSWGQDWGDDGFAWIGYDVADKFNRSGDAEQLIDFGVVMVDSRQPVELRNGRYEVVTFDEVQILGRPRFTGVDEDGQPRYDVFVSLVGPDKLMDNFEAVNWAVTDSRGERLVPETKNTETDYGAVVTTRDRQPMIAAAALNTDGRVVTYRRRLQLPEAVDRQITLERIDSYYMSQPTADEDNRLPVWRWTIVPRMSEQDWADLEKIEWRIQRDDVERRNRRRVADSPRKLAVIPGDGPFTYQHAVSGAPPRDQQLLAYPSGISNKPPRGEAVLHFRDGTQVVRPLPEDVWADPAEDNFQYDFVIRPSGEFKSQSWHYFEVIARYPEVWDHYWHDGHFRFNGIRPEGFHREPGHRTEGDAPAAMIYASYAASPFKVDAMVELVQDPSDPDAGPVRRGTRTDLYDGLAWRAVGGGSPVYQYVPIGDNSLKIYWRDRYIGMRDGKPTWQFDVWLDEVKKRSPRAPKSVEWTLPDGKKKVKTRGKDAPPHLMASTTAHGPFDAKVEMQWHKADEKQRPTTLTQRIIPRSPQDNALSFRVFEGLPGEDVETAKQSDLLRPQIIGPKDQTDRIVEVVYGSGSRLVRKSDELENDGNELTNITLERDPESETVDAIFRMQDGSSIVKTAKPTQRPPYTVLPPIQLDVSARYFDKVVNKKKWRVNAKLTGHPERLDQVKRVDYRIEGKYAKSRPMRKSRHRDGAYASVPFRLGNVTARIAYTEESGLEPEVLTSKFEVSWKQDYDKPELARLTREYIPFWVDRNAQNIWATARDPECHHLLYIQANLSDLQKISKVEYRVTDLLKKSRKPEEALTVHKVTKRTDGKYDGFPFHLHQTYARYEIHADVHYLGGRKVTLGPLEIESLQQ